jgi:hypothetical protein
MNFHLDPFGGGLPTVCQGLSISNFGSFGGEIRIEIGLAVEHGTSDSKEPVSDRAKGAGKTVSSAAKSGVFDAASLVVLRSDAGPIVDGGSQPDVS